MLMLAQRRSEPLLPEEPKGVTGTEVACIFFFKHDITFRVYPRTFVKVGLIEKCFSFMTPKRCHSHR